MILIVNTSNLRQGGGIQVALSFINELIKFPENEYHVFLGHDVFLQINSKTYPNNFYFYHILHSPASLRYAFLIINKLIKLENSINPDCVITVFGPSYWTPKSPHLLGYAQGYYLYPESPYFRRINFFRKKKINLLKIIHRFFFLLNAKNFLIESEDAKKRLSIFLNINLNNIHVISNTYHAVFKKEIRNYHLLSARKGEIRLITITSYYGHKNLEIIKETIDHLKKKSSLKFVFVLTINSSLFESKFKDFKENIINLGPLPIESCPSAYNECDLMFLPSLIEIFTATYPEAMKMKLPILTSDLPFAHSICGNAAEYFDPLNSEDIANKIIFLATNRNRQKELIQFGLKRLEEFETPNSRARRILNLCYKISN
jgi:glycosyltransferase involved in cell wall biosynthesis